MNSDPHHSQLGAKTASQTASLESDEITELRFKIYAEEKRNADLFQDNMDLEKELEILRERLEDAETEYEISMETIDQLKGSLSWKITMPIRALSRMARGDIKGAFFDLARPFWPALAKILTIVPGGMTVRNRLIAVRTSQIEAARLNDVLEKRKRRNLFHDTDLSGFSETQTIGLVKQALKERPETTQNVAPIIADLAALTKRSEKDLFRIYKQGVLSQFLSQGHRLSLPKSDRPKISVILILYNNAELTLACLQSLSQARDVPIEIIIIDNASSDQTSDMLERIDGAIIQKNEDNLGFLRAVNQGAKIASGENLLLLNNDATLRKGTLSAALRRLSSEDNIGAVGGRIMLLNGTLQEAGSIVWQDGSCLGYARGDKEDAPHVMFSRDVDYCSGAFLLTPRAVWDELGGLDPIYAPAYYEETDYCMRVWQSGKRVVYDPAIVIDHFEFGSATKSDWAIAQQQKNQKIFVERHKEALKQHLSPDVAHIQEARQRHVPDQMNVLIIDDRVPHRHMGGGYPRAHDIATMVYGLGYKLTYFPLRFPSDIWSETYNTLPDRVEVLADIGISGFANYMKENVKRFDVIIVSRPHNMASFKNLYDEAPALFDKTRIVYDAEAVFANRDIAKADMLGTPFSDEKIKSLIEAETVFAKPAQAVATVSRTEANSFLQTGSEQVEVLGHSISLKVNEVDLTSRREILFVGALVGEDTPNVDSLIWFVNEVMPRITEKHGAPIPLNIVGKVASKAIRSLQSEHVRLLGRVDDLSQSYDMARLFIAPTRYAGGIPHKVHEAAAHGLPCVVTPLLSDQLGWRHEGAVLVGRDADDFAEQVVRLYRDDALWKSVQANAMKKMEEDCSPEHFQAVLKKLIEGR